MNWIHTIEFRYPFTQYVRIAIRINNRKAKNKYISIWIGHYTQLIIFFLRTNQHKVSSIACSSHDGSLPVRHCRRDLECIVDYSRSPWLNAEIIRETGGETPAEAYRRNSRRSSARRDLEGIHRPCRRCTRWSEHQRTFFQWDVLVSCPYFARVSITCKQ